MSLSIYLDGYMACKLCLAVQLHFKKDSYDIFQSKGRLSYTKEKFEQRPDKNIFYHLSGEYRKGDLADFFMANVMAGCSHVSEFTDVNFREWKSRIYRLDYMFASDVKNMAQIARHHNLTFNQLFVSVTGDLPIAIQLLNGGHISLETICVIDEILGGEIILRFDEQIRDKFAWPKIRLNIVKYQPWLLMKIDAKELKQVLIENMN